MQDKSLENMLALRRVFRTVFEYAAKYIGKRTETELRPAAAEYAELIEAAEKRGNAERELCEKLMQAVYGYLVCVNGGEKDD